MNSVTITGRLTNGPELKETTSGNKYTRFCVACDRQKEGTDFINCIAWGNTAEFLSKYFTKGKPILLQGRLQTGSYEKDGHKVSTVDVVAEKVEFVLKDNSEKEKEGGFTQITDDEMPF